MDYKVKQFGRFVGIRFDMFACVACLSMSLFLCFSAFAQQSLYQLADSVHYQLPAITHDALPSIYARQPEFKSTKTPLQQANLPLQTLRNTRYSLIFTFHFDHPRDGINGLFISTLGAYHAYWDGELITQNGQPANDKAGEVAGMIDWVVPLDKRHLTAGTHELVLDVSSHYAPENLSTTRAWAAIGDYEFMVTIALKRAIVPLVMSGATVLLSFYLVVTYFSTHREAPSLLFCGLFCVALLLMMCVESWRGLIGYSYDWHYMRLQVVNGLSATSALCMTLFISYLFILPKPWLVRIVVSFSLGVVGIYVLIASDDLRSLGFVLLGSMLSMGLCVYAWSQKQRYARVMLFSVLLFLSPVVIHPFDFMDRYFFVASAILIGFMLFVQARDSKAKQQQVIQSEQAQLRLELELVKRNLQPHFILNTLTAVEEWIEESPETAVTFIQALADEFRVMAKLSTKTLISLQDELMLCRSYLRVMGFRTNLKFSLVTDNITPQQALPPGVLLTLIENAISHNYYREGEVTFRLQQDTTHPTTTLIFESPTTTQRGQPLHTGTGQQYINARLTESFTHQWDFSAIDEAQCWRVKITIPCVHTESVDSNEMLDTEAVYGLR